MPGRNASSSDYRYGFIGQENDNEVNNVTSNSNDIGLIFNYLKRFKSDDK